MYDPCSEEPPAPRRKKLPGGCEVCARTERVSRRRPTSGKLHAWLGNGQRPVSPPPAARCNHHDHRYAEPEAVMVPPCRLLRNATEFHWFSNRISACAYHHMPSIPSNVCYLVIVVVASARQACGLLCSKRPCDRQ
jgi:hypothetical protein